MVTLVQLEKSGMAPSSRRTLTFVSLPVSLLAPWATITQTMRFTTAVCVYVISSKS